MFSQLKNLMVVGKLLFLKQVVLDFGFLYLLPNGSSKKKAGPSGGSLMLDAAFFRHRLM